MLNWLKKGIYNASLDAQRREITAWLDNLKALNSDEVGLIAAMAFHSNNKLGVGLGVDLSRPFSYETAALSDLVMRLHGTIKEIQKAGKPEFATGLMVWLFTLRCAIAPELRMLGRELWAELTRGFPHIQDSAIDFQLATGTPLDLSGAGKVPEGFEAKPT